MNENQVKTIRHNLLEFEDIIRKFQQIECTLHLIGASDLLSDDDISAAAIQLAAVNLFSATQEMVPLYNEMLAAAGIGTGNENGSDN